MPIYMDRHDVSEDVTAEIVADLHHRDLKIQHKFGCRGLAYWFDDKRKTAFCLVEAPNKDSIQDMHDHAHGVVANQIIEVDASVVESFLGRIEDPKKSKKATLNIINDPGFRTIMVVHTKGASLKDISYPEKELLFSNKNFSLIQLIEKFGGRLVKQKAGYHLISFNSVTQAVRLALEILAENPSEPAGKISSVRIKMALSAGVPVTNKETIFEETIQMTERFCNFVKGQLVVSAEVKDLYESENLNVPLTGKNITVLKSKDEKFLNLLVDHIENECGNPTLNSYNIGKYIGYSKSQLYRKMIALTAKSPNRFIKDYRLNHALGLLNQNEKNISEVAFETGFNTPGYFSKCFLETFGILPSHYVKSFCS